MTKRQKIEMTKSVKKKRQKWGGIKVNHCNYLGYKRQLITPVYGFMEQRKRDQKNKVTKIEKHTKVTKNKKSEKRQKREMTK